MHINLHLLTLNMLLANDWFSITLLCIGYGSIGDDRCTKDVDESIPGADSIA